MKQISIRSRMRLGALSATTLLFSLALAGCNNSGAGGSAGIAGGGDTLATVGGTAVTRTQLAQFLEATSGEQALPVLIDSALITEEAKAKGITITDEEVNAELARRQEADPNIAAQIKDSPGRQEIVKNQLRRDLTVMRLLTADVKMDDAKLKKYFDTYRSYYDTAAKTKVGLLMTSTKVRADALDRALKSGKKFEDLVTEQQKANDQLAKNSNADWQVIESLPGFDPKILEAINKTAVGKTTTIQTIPAGPSQNIFAIFRVNSRQAAKKADYAALKPVLENDAKMMEVAVSEIKKNPQNPQKVEDNLRAVAQQLSGGNPGVKPTMRDILSFILRPASEVRLTELRTKGTVAISDANYVKIAEIYKPAPAAPSAAGTPGATPAAGAPTAP